MSEPDQISVTLERSEIERLADKRPLFNETRDKLRAALSSKPSQEAEELADKLELLANVWGPALPDNAALLREAISYIERTQP